MYYKEITQKYLKEQESLGIENPLEKLVEWRILIDFIGMPISTDNRITIEKWSQTIVKKWSQPIDVLLNWINTDSLKRIDTNNTLRLLENILGCVGIFTDFSKINIVHVDRLTIKDVDMSECPIDVRFFELIYLKNVHSSTYVDMCFCLNINSAREAHSICKAIEPIVELINTNDIKISSYFNHRMSDFLTHFHIKEQTNWKINLVQVLYWFQRYAEQNWDQLGLQSIGGWNA